MITLFHFIQYLFLLRNASSSLSARQLSNTIKQQQRNQRGLELVLTCYFCNPYCNMNTILQSHSLVIVSKKQLFGSPFVLAKVPIRSPSHSKLNPDWVPILNKIWSPQHLGAVLTPFGLPPFGLRGHLDQVVKIGTLNNTYRFKS